MSTSSETSADRIQRIGAYALCLDPAGSILLSRYTSGTWGLPGGGVDHGEHPEETVVREVAEETGFTARVRELMGLDSATWTTREGREIHAISVVYRVELVGGALRPELDGSSDLAAWIPIDRLDDHPHTELIDIVVGASREGGMLPRWIRR